MSCWSCYGDVQVNVPQYLGALEADVIEPMRLVQRLIDQQPYVTRLYSTLSAAEMTADPVFTYNRDLRDMSNLHTARRVIECNPDVYAWQANWRIELPQGGVVRGTADDVGVWPGAVNEQPANVRIRTLSESGPGRVMQDNSEAIRAMLDTYNATVREPQRLPDGMMGLPTNASTGARPGGSPTSSGMSSRPYSGSTGCAIAQVAAPRSPLLPGVALSVLAGAVLGLRRRRS
jgi:hypothetical protein